MSGQKNTNGEFSKRNAYKLIILFGLISLFGDIVYEGARSVNGAFLELLAVNAATLGIITGIGEFFGYALRLLSGYLSDKTRSYWFFTFLGYGLLVSVPLLTMAGTWQIAALFIITERVGKAIRSPARDTILSQASFRVGTGFGFGLHEAMDQIGAIAGPLIFTAFFFALGCHSAGIHAYQQGYMLLWVPFLFLLLCLVFSWRSTRRNGLLETESAKPHIPDKLTKIFWLYTLFTFVSTLGFCNFILIAFHFKSSGVLSDAKIPLYYALAMGIDGIAALSIGKLYDILKSRSNNHYAGLNLLFLIPIATLLIPIYIFSNKVTLIITGAVIWGLVMGTHETIMRSAIADITSFKKRGTGYGVFNTTYGLGFFLGSVLIGYLYDRSVALVYPSVILIECLAIVVLLFLKRAIKNIGKTDSF